MSFSLLIKRMKWRIFIVKLFTAVNVRSPRARPPLSTPRPLRSRRCPILRKPHVHGSRPIPQKPRPPPPIPRQQRHPSLILPSPSILTPLSRRRRPPSTPWAPSRPHTSFSAQSAVRPSARLRPFRSPSPNPPPPAGASAAAASLSPNPNLSSLDGITDAAVARQIRTNSILLAPFLSPCAHKWATRSGLAMN
jgi:hypothetical protein